MSTGNEENFTIESCLTSISDHLDADIYVISGGIDRDTAYTLMKEFEKAQHRTNCFLILTTYGGDPDGAYIISKFMRRYYKNFVLYVCGFCKSAGTLIALGANEIVISHRGELGPIDVQTFIAENLVRQNSGLDIMEALNSIGEQALTLWEDHFLKIINRSQGIITTRTAADIASSLAVQLLSPITAQIDPLRLGEIQRAINIAMKYGELLGASPRTIHRLIYGYPSHGFVIDIDEAMGLFENVRHPTTKELALAYALCDQMKAEYGEECIWSPHSTGVVVCLTRIPVEEEKQENEDDESDEQEIYLPTRPNERDGENNEANSQSDQKRNQESFQGKAVEQGSNSKK
ncbi:MAG: hypothetical protein U0350_45310 [Caldilineaceae bacterium]